MNKIIYFVFYRNFKSLLCKASISDLKLPYLDISVFRIGSEEPTCPELSNKSGFRTGSEGQYLRNYPTYPDNGHDLKDRDSLKCVVSVPDGFI